MVNHVDRHVAARVVLIPGDGGGGIRDRRLHSLPSTFSLVKSEESKKSQEKAETKIDHDHWCEEEKNDR